MKNIYTLALICFCSINVFQAAAQDKEDLLEAMELIFDLAETEPLFQHDLREGETLVLRRLEKRSMGRTNQLEDLLFELRDDDFYSFSRPVKIMSRQEAATQGIDERYLAMIGFRFSPNEIKFSITSTLQDNLLLYSGNFSVIRSSADDDWEINSRDFQTQKTR